MTKEIHDKQTGYCRMLGHKVPFTYCRTMKEDLPCSRIKNCWYEFIDIASYIESNYTEEEQSIIFAPPRDKVTSLLTLIEEAKARATQ